MITDFAGVLQIIPMDFVSEESPVEDLSVSGVCLTSADALAISEVQRHHSSDRAACSETDSRLTLGFALTWKAPPLTQYCHVWAAWLDAQESAEGLCWVWLGSATLERFKADGVAVPKGGQTLHVAVQRTDVLCRAESMDNAAKTCICVRLS